MALFAVRCKYQIAITQTEHKIVADRELLHDCHLQVDYSEYQFLLVTFGVASRNLTV